MAEAQGCGRMPERKAGIGLTCETHPERSCGPGGTAFILDYVAVHQVHPAVVC